jgi:hypothetical protein
MLWSQRHGRTTTLHLAASRLTEDDTEASRAFIVDEVLNAGADINAEDHVSPKSTFRPNTLCSRVLNKSIQFTNMRSASLCREGGQPCIMLRVLVTS